MMCGHRIIAPLDEDADHDEKHGEEGFQAGVGGAMAQKAHDGDSSPESRQRVPDDMASHCTISVGFVSTCVGGPAPSKPLVLYPEGFLPEIFRAVWRR